jgi:TRAP-type C4-dicarboxylate transport system permease small subunit
VSDGQRTGPIDRVSAWLAVAGGCLVLALVLLVCASVLRRWLMAEAIPGDFELVQTGLALAVFAAMPICQLHRTNIVVDSFTARAPAALRDGLDGLWALVHAAAAALIGWQMVAGTRDAFAAGTGSMVLGLPLGWGMAASTALVGWLALAALVSALRALRRVRRG